MKKETKAKLEEIKAMLAIADMESQFNRARAITVGTAFGGTTEITMRGDGGKYLYCIMQPVETMELIHQLAANVGCHIAIKPREDFASWRGWKVSDEERLRLNRHPPFADSMDEHMQVGANLPPPEQQPGMKLNMKEQQNVVAIKKTVNRRSAKRASKAP